MSLSAAFVLPADPDCGCSTGSDCGCGQGSTTRSGRSARLDAPDVRQRFHGADSGQDRGAVLARALHHGVGPHSDLRGGMLERALLHGAEFDGEWRGATTSRLSVHGVEFDGDWRNATTDAPMIGRPRPGADAGAGLRAGRAAGGGVSSLGEVAANGVASNILHCPLGGLPTGTLASGTGAAGYLPAVAGWVAADLCYLDPDWTNEEQLVLNAAMFKLHDGGRAEDVSRFFDHYRNAFGASVSGNCTTNLFQVSGAGAVLHVKKVDASAHRCDLGGTDWIGCTPLPGSATVWLSEAYVAAVVGSIKAAEDNCERACIIGELAGTLAHEAMHVCLHGEPAAYMMGAFIRAEAASETGGDPTCCQQAHLPSYDWSAWPSLADLKTYCWQSPTSPVSANLSGCACVSELRQIPGMCK